MFKAPAMTAMFLSETFHTPRSTREMLTTDAIYTVIKRPHSLAVTTPATILTYNVGDSLDISGLCPG